MLVTFEGGPLGETESSRLGRTHPADHALDAPALRRARVRVARAPLGRDERHHEDRRPREREPEGALARKAHDGPYCANRADWPRAGARSAALTLKALADPC